MSRNLKKLEIQSTARWKDGVTIDSFSILYGFRDSDESYDAGTDGPIKEILYEDGLPVFYISCTDEPSVRSDKFTYVGKYTLNGTIYDRWEEWNNNGGTYNASGYAALTEEVVTDIYPVQVESANCDEDGHIISNTYIKKSNATGAFVTGGQYTQLSDFETLYRHNVEVVASSQNSNTITFRAVMYDNDPQTGSATWNTIKNYINGHPVEWWISDGPDRDYNTYAGVFYTFSNGVTEIYSSGAPILAYINSVSSCSVTTADEVK